MNNKHKILILALMAIIALSDVFAQDVVSPQALNSVRNNTAIQRAQPTFIRAWNWGSSGAAIDTALRINAYHNFPTFSYDNSNTNIASNMYIIQQANSATNEFVFGPQRVNYLTNAQSLHLEPILSANSMTDNTNSIFRFDYKALGSIGTGPDAERFVLKKNLVAQGYATVLKNNTGSKILQWMNYPDKTSIANKRDINTQSDIDNYHHFNGKQFYLSINLRAISPSELTANLNNTILNIKLRYKSEIKPKDSLFAKPYGTGDLYFSRFPKLNETENGQSNNLPIIGAANSDYRGVCRRMTADGEQPRSIDFKIKGSMLSRSDSASPNNSITLSAFVDLSGKKNAVGEYVNGPALKGHEWGNYSDQEIYISELEVDVRYYGKVDVAIDWIRLETPRAQELYRGVYDDEINEAVTWNLDNIASHPKQPKLFRFYGNDELLPCEWHAMKYLNSLLDGLVTMEWFPNGSDPSMPDKPGLFQKYTGISEMWSGDNIHHISATGAPYIKKGKADYSQSPELSSEHFGLRYGYAGNNLMAFDSLNSGYETNVVQEVMNIGRSNIPLLQTPRTNYSLLTTEYPYSGYYWNYGTLFLAEKQIYNGYYLQPTLLYNSTNWWANLWINIEPLMIENNRMHMKLDADNSKRPRTGEEIRFETNMPIILGAKGLLYWYKGTSWEDSTQTKLWMGLLPSAVPNTALKGEELVLSDLNGGDYILQSNDPNGLSPYLSTNFFNLADLGIPINRMYLGLKSTRFEIMKLNKWIERIDSNKLLIPSLYQESLMDLRLVAWKGKGFTTMYSQDPSASANVMNNYIKKDQILTAKLWQPNGGSLNNNYRNAEVNAYVRRWESTDSSFYDITILRPNTFAIGDLSRFYIGVQNRRTDPLVWDVSTNPGRVKFYSTAEYYEGCHSTNNNVALYFNEYYWKKMGCRIIRVPLSDNFILTAGNRFAIKVKEIMSDDWTFNSDNYKWRNMNWCHLPNFYQAGSTSGSTLPTSLPAPMIDIKLQPGEGKLLKVEKIIIPVFNFANNRTLSNEETPLNMELAMSRNDSLVYDVVFRNNTENQAEQLGIILSDEVGEPISIQPVEGIQVADYMEENKIISNSKVIIVHDLKPKSEIVIGQVSCSKKNPAKFTYFLDVVNEKNERGSYKMAASMNNIHHKSADGLESIDNKVSNISIAPNPAKDRAELSFTASEQGNAEIIVVDILGNQLLRISDYIAYPGANSLNINLSNFSGGVYNVIVKTISGVSTQKFSVVK